MQVPPLVLRLSKGSPLTPAEGDENFRLLRDFSNSLANLFGVALNPDGTIKNPTVRYGASQTLSDAYAFTFSPAPANQAALLGQIIILKADVANVGAATFNANTFGPFAIKKFGNIDLDTNDIKAGQYVFLSWDGTFYQMQSWPGVVQRTNYGVDTGAVDHLVVNQLGINHIPAAYYDGYTILVKVANTNVGAPDLKVGGLAITPIMKNGATALAAGDLTVGQVVQFVYAGAVFHLTSVGSRTLVHRSADTIFTMAANVPVITNQSHGLGALIPDTAQLYLVARANNGATDYAVGDCIPIESALHDETNIAPLTLGTFINGTYSVYSRSVSQNFLISNKTTGAVSVPVTPANLALDWLVRAVFTRIV